MLAHTGGGRLPFWVLMLARSPRCNLAPAVRPRNGGEVFRYRSRLPDASHAECRSPFPKLRRVRVGVAAVWPKEAPRQNPRKHTIWTPRKVHLLHLVYLRTNSNCESLLSPEPSASADAEALLDSPVFLAVLLCCPDECPSDDREREHADSGNHYPEEGAHDGSLGAAGRQPAGPGQCSGMTPESWKKQLTDRTLAYASVDAGTATRRQIDVSRSRSWLKRLVNHADAQVPRVLACVPGVVVRARGAAVLDADAGCVGAGG